MEIPKLAQVDYGPQGRMQNVWTFGFKASHDAQGRWTIWKASPQDQAGWEHATIVGKAKVSESEMLRRFARVADLPKIPVVGRADARKGLQYTYEGTGKSFHLGQVATAPVTDAKDGARLQFVAQKLDGHWVFNRQVERGGTLNVESVRLPVAGSGDRPTPPRTPRDVERVLHLLAQNSHFGEHATAEQASG